MLILLIATHEAGTILLRRLSCLFRRYIATETGILNDNAQFDRSNRTNKSAIRRGDVNLCGINIAVIINNIHFTHSGERVGTREDEDNLKTTLADIGLGVMVYRDADTNTLLKILQRVAKMDHSHRECFVCVILSHGGQLELTQDGEQRMCDIIECKDTFISARKLVECFRDDEAPTLVNKPRLFFIQACRGAAGPATVQLAEDDRQPVVIEPALWEEDDRILNYALPSDLPIYPEFMLAWATVPGYYAFRGNTGSPFIEYLCKGLRDYREHDLLTILTWVQNRVAIEYTARTVELKRLHRWKQMPWVASMLTTNVRL